MLHKYSGIFKTIFLIFQNSNIIVTSFRLLRNKKRQLKYIKYGIMQALLSKRLGKVSAFHGRTKVNTAEIIS